MVHGRQLRSFDMWRVFTLIILIASSLAQAQDKGKSEVSHTAEFRLRDAFEQNESGNASVKPNHHNAVDQRFKLGVGFRANEKFSLTATLLQSAAFGQTRTENINERGQTTSTPGNLDERNFLSVNEAYVAWLMADDLNVKFGRMNYAFGDGAIMAVNDWQAQPYSYEGVEASYEAEFGRLQAFAFKMRDFSGSSPGSLTGTTKSTTSDPQRDSYGLVFDLKVMPEWLKLLNANFIQDVADGITDTSTGVGSTVQKNQSQKALRFGAAASVAYGMFDFKADYEGISGKNSDLGANTPVRLINASMYQGELGINFPTVMLSHVFLGFHVDSGMKQADATTADRTYDPYFYDKHSGSGLMELVAWGNLTYFSAGWTGKPSDTTDVGLAYYMFSKTEKEDMVRPGYYGKNLFLNATACDPTGAVAGGSACARGIGNEIDLWAEHRYDGGLSLLGRLGYFMPGATLKNNWVREDNASEGLVHQTASLMQVMVQGKLTF